MKDFETARLSRGPLVFSGLASGEAPLVLLLHGFPDHARSWRYQLPALSNAGYRVVAMSIRDYEPSSQPHDEDYRLETLAYFPPEFVQSEAFKAYIPQVPAGRLATGREDALFALFLTSDESDFFVGQSIPFSGGWLQ